MPFTAESGQLGADCGPGSGSAPIAQSSGYYACPSGFCTGVSFYQLVCTIPCHVDADCLPGWTCTDTRGFGSYCTCGASTETCDGRDNDCNGIVDDEPTADRSCEGDGGAFVCASGNCGCGGALCGSACVDTRSDPLHCGDCATACPGAPNAAAACFDGGCGYVCNPGFGDCDGRTDDGCELAVDGDPNKCGGCGHSCQPAACDAGLCAPVGLATSSSPVSAGPFVIDPDAGVALVGVYFTAGSIEEARVYELSLLDGGSRDLGWSNPDFAPLAMAATPEALFLTLGAKTFAGHEKVFGLWRGDGGTFLFVPDLSAHAIAADESGPYWAGQPQSGGPRGLYREPLDAGGPILFADGVARGIALDADRVYWTNATYSDTGTIRRVSADGGAVDVLATAFQPGPMLISGGWIYWGQQDAIMRMPLDGGTPTALASIGPPAVSLAVDDTRAYWASGGPDGGVFEVPLQGGPVVTLARANAAAVGLWGDRVYWTDGTTSFWSVPK